MKKILVWLWSERCIFKQQVVTAIKKGEMTIESFKEKIKTQLTKENELLKLIQKDKDTKEVSYTEKRIKKRIELCENALKFDPENQNEQPKAEEKDDSINDVSIKKEIEEQSEKKLEPYFSEEEEGLLVTRKVS